MRRKQNNYQKNIPLPLYKEELKKAYSSFIKFIQAANKLFIPLRVQF